MVYEWVLIFKIQLENLWTSMEFSEAYSAYSENFLMYLFCGDHFTEFRLWGIIGRFQYFIKRDSVEAEANSLWRLAALKPALGIWKCGVQLRTAGTNTLESVKKKLSNVTFFMVYSDRQCRYTYFYIPWKSKPTTIKSIMAWNCLIVNYKSFLKQWSFQRPFKQKSLDFQDVCIYILV